MVGSSHCNSNSIAALGIRDSFESSSLCWAKSLFINTYSMSWALLWATTHLNLSISSHSVSIFSWTSTHLCWKYLIRELRSRHSPVEDIIQFVAAGEYPVCLLHSILSCRNRSSRYWRGCSGTTPGIFSTTFSSGDNDISKNYKTIHTTNHITTARMRATAMWQSERKRFNTMPESHNPEEDSVEESKYDNREKCADACYPHDESEDDGRDDCRDKCLPESANERWTELSHDEPCAEEESDDFHHTRSCIWGWFINSRILCVSSNIILRTINPIAIMNTIPIRVRRVMRRDLIHPRAFQRVMKKNTPTMKPTMRAGMGLRKYDANQTATSMMRRAMRVFVTLFQRETGSSLRSAKKTKKRLNTPRAPSAISIQNGVFPPVKYALYGAIFARSASHACAESITSTGGMITGGSGSVGSAGACGSPFGRSPRSISPQKMSAHHEQMLKEPDCESIRWCILEYLSCVEYAFIIDRIESVIYHFKTSRICFWHEFSVKKYMTSINWIMFRQHLECLGSASGIMPCGP